MEVQIPNCTDEEDNEEDEQNDDVKEEVAVAVALSLADDEIETAVELENIEAQLAKCERLNKVLKQCMRHHLEMLDDTAELSKLISHPSSPVTHCPSDIKLAVMSTKNMHHLQNASTGNATSTAGG
jgi:hypothetical protein